MCCETHCETFLLLMENHSKQHKKAVLSYKICQADAIIKQDGTSPIRLRVITNRVKKELNLNVSWPSTHFDKQNQRCLPRFVGDKADCEAANILIEDAKSKASRIVMRYYANDKSLDIETFAKEFQDYQSRENLLKFWETKTEQLFDDKIITYETAKRHRSSRKRVQTYLNNNELLFTDLSLEFIQKYDHYLRKTKKYAHNTVCGFHKDLKTYINHAIDTGHRVVNPYFKFSYSYRAGERAVLDQEELASLKKMVDTDRLTPTENEVLKSFLFSCYTGLRVSDNRLLHSDMITNGVMTVKTKKGAKFGKEVSIPLPDYAKKLIEGREGKIFSMYAEKTRNEVLKILAAKASIQKKLTFHVSRDTFGTLFIELGGDPATLKELMGHTNIAVTMIYVKISEQRKKTLMMNFNLL